MRNKISLTPSGEPATRLLLGAETWSQDLRSGQQRASEAARASYFPVGFGFWSIVVFFLTFGVPNHRENYDVKKLSIHFM